MLGSRPHPHHCEAAHGYFLRLADINGFMSIPELFSARDIKTFSNLIKLDESKIKELCEHLSPAMNGRSANEVYTGLAQPAPQSLIYSSFRLIQDLRVTTPRICTECIQQTGIDWHWSLLPVYQCLNHSRKLIEACPQCYTKLRWHYEVFTHCHKCDLKWSNFEFSREKIGPLQKELYSIKDKCSQSILDKVDDVVLATMIAARPFDSFYQSLQCMPRFDDSISLVEKAYGLLCDPILRQNWISEVKSQRQCLSDTPEKIFQAPVKYFNLMIQEEWPKINLSKYTYADWEEFPEFVRPARRKLSPANEIKFQCKQSALAVNLGVNRSTLSELIEKGDITALNQKQTPRDQLFDIRTPRINALELKE